MNLNQGYLLIAPGGAEKTAATAVSNNTTSTSVPRRENYGFRHEPRHEVTTGGCPAEFFQNVCCTSTALFNVYPNLKMLSIVCALGSAATPLQVLGTSVLTAISCFSWGNTVRSGVSGCAAANADFSSGSGSGF